MDNRYAGTDDCLSNEWKMVKFESIFYVKIEKKKNLYFPSVDVYNYDGPSVDALSRNKQDTQAWTWNVTDGSVRSKHNGQCLTVQQELEVWAGPLLDGSQAVVLLNRGDIGSETITVEWADLSFPTNHSALVRDIWARKDVGTFTGSYISPNIEHRGVMMLKITLNK